MANWSADRLSRVTQKNSSFSVGFLCFQSSYLFLGGSWLWHVLGQSWMGRNSSFSLLRYGIIYVHQARIGHFLSVSKIGHVNSPCLMKDFRMSCGFV